MAWPPPVSIWRDEANLESCPAWRSARRNASGPTLAGRSLAVDFDHHSLTAPVTHGNTDAARTRYAADFAHPGDRARDAVTSERSHRLVVGGAASLTRVAARTARVRRSPTSGYGSIPHARVNVEVDWRIVLTAVVIAVVVAIVTGAVGAKARKGKPSRRQAQIRSGHRRLSAPDARVIARPRSPAGPDRLYIPSMTLSTLIYAAYGDGGFNTSMRVTGGPDWINKTAFAVEGVASGQATLRQLRLMLQTPPRGALCVEDSHGACPTGDVLALVDGPQRRDSRSKGHEVGRHLSPVMPALYFQAPRRTAAEMGVGSGFGGG